MLKLQIKKAGAEGCRCCAQHKHVKFQRIHLHCEYLGLPSPLGRVRKGSGVSRMRSAAAATALVTAEQAGLAKDERSAVDESSRLTGGKVKVIGGISPLTCRLLQEVAWTPPGSSHVLYTAGRPCSCRVLYILAIQLCQTNISYWYHSSSLRLYVCCRLGAQGLQCGGAAEQQWADCS